MKQNTSKKILFISFIFFLLTPKIFSQDKKVSITQDPKFEQLLNDKRKINSSITVNDRYKIQIYNGDAETSKKTLLDFKRNFKEYDGTIVFYTPIYKVWVGNFKSRIEAEKNLIVLKKKYPAAFLIKPNK